MKNRFNYGRGKRIIESGKGQQIYNLLKAGCSKRSAMQLVNEPYNGSLCDDLFNYFESMDVKDINHTMPDKYIPNKLPYFVNEMAYKGESFKNLYLPVMEDISYITVKSRL